MNTIVTAEIDVATPAGRRIVRDLEKRRSVKLNYPAPEEVNVEGYTLEQSYNLCMNKMSELYGVDVRKL
ncbi:hypothetical protein FACS1894145_6640 [Bacteroidia bacterium]|nr:hypothetical protein FACS1894145_6640 [Bacteroidia bacterium]